MAVGEKLGLRGRELETLHYASLLHDVGKLGVPESVLRKEGPLDAQRDRAQMRRHPEIGARMLERLETAAGRGAARPPPPGAFRRRARTASIRAIRRGSSGEQIPLGARIIAVVDAFDAMTTTRPYREALPAGRGRGRAPPGAGAAVRSAGGGRLPRHVSPSGRGLN